MHYICNAMARHSQFTFRLPAGLAGRIDRYARSTGRKRSDVVRQATEAYLDALEGTSVKPAERAGNLIGSIRSGVPDLAERHSEYLKRILRGR